MISQFQDSVLLFIVDYTFIHCFFCSFTEHCKHQPPNRPVKSLIFIPRRVNTVKQDAVHKRRPQSRGVDCAVWIYCRLGGRQVLQVRMSALFGVKNLKFFEICDVSEQTRGKES